MKKFTLLFLFFSLAVAAQVFPDMDATYLKPGMKLKTGNKPYPYKNFYESIEEYKRYKAKGSSTPVEFLNNRVFEVTEVKHDPEPTIASQPEFNITLKDINNQEVIYYKHRQSLAGTMYVELMMTEDINLPYDYFCKYIEGSSSTVYMVYPDIYVRLHRYTDNGKKAYNLMLMTELFKQNSGKGTITITLKNNQKIIKKNITAKEDSNDIGEASYEAVLTLTEAEMKLIQANEIVSYNFFGLHDEIVKQQTAGIISGSIDCLMNR